MLIPRGSSPAQYYSASLLLYQIGERFEHPNVANWTQQDNINDPFAVRGNRYAYMNDDPVNNSAATEMSVAVTRSGMCTDSPTYRGAHASYCRSVGGGAGEPFDALCLTTGSFSGGGYYAGKVVAR